MFIERAILTSYFLSYTQGIVWRPNTVEENKFSVNFPLFLARILFEALKYRVSNQSLSNLNFNDLTIAPI
jgi:hypothetical protein